MKAHYLLVVLLLIGILMVSGCVKTPIKQLVSEEVTKQSTGEEPLTSGTGVPTTDVAGKDISDIPRYTGSVRIFSGEVPLAAEGTIVVVYLTTASIDEVLDFYITQFPANGWTILDRGEISKMPTAEKEGRFAVITITNSGEYSGYTDINIVAGPK